MRTGQCLLICFVILFVLVAIICHLVALATNYWLRSSSASQKDFLNIGLWVACFDNYEHPHETEPKTYDGCDSLYSDTYSTIQDWLIPSWLVACRVLAVIALVLEAVGLLLVVLLLVWVLCKCIMCDPEDDVCGKILLYAAPIVWILAGMFLMMTVMIFADNAFRLQCKDFWLGGADPNDNHLSYSWGFEVAACVFAFVGGGLLIWFVVLKGRGDI